MNCKWAQVVQQISGRSIERGVVLTIPKPIPRTPSPRHLHIEIDRMGERVLLLYDFPLLHSGMLSRNSRISNFASINCARVNVETVDEVGAFVQPLVPADYPSLLILGQ